jgi:hypothetical protein
MAEGAASDHGIHTPCGLMVRNAWYIQLEDLTGLRVGVSRNLPVPLEEEGFLAFLSVEGDRGHTVQSAFGRIDRREQEEGAKGVDHHNRGRVDLAGSVP